MTRKKYKFTGKVKKTEDGKVYRQIVALRRFGDVKTGDVGGWIESESNLSHEGRCWVGRGAVVAELAKVFEDAQVTGGAFVHDQAKVSGHARVYGSSHVGGRSYVFEDAKVSGRAQIDENARIRGHANVGDHAFVGGCATVSGNALVDGHATVFDQTEVYGNAHVCGSASIQDHASVFDHATVRGNALVDSYAKIGGDAVVKTPLDYAVVKNSWDDRNFLDKWFTYTRSNKTWRSDVFHGPGFWIVEKEALKNKKFAKCLEIAVKAQEEIDKIVQNIRKESI